MLSHINKKVGSPCVSPLHSGDDSLLRDEEFRTSNPIVPMESQIFSNIAHTASKGIGPIAIIGGTASIYSSALSHSSSTLTPLSTIYLFLLALNYSIMPRISKKFVHPETNKRSLALIEELVKFAIGIGGFLLTDNFNSVKKWTLQSLLIAAGLPSTLYAIQGIFTYTAYQNLDSFTFNGLTQLKILSAALCCFLVLGKPQSPIQIFALGLLSITPLVFEGKINIRSLWRKQTNDQSQLSFKRNLTGGSSIDMNRRFLFGILPCVGATLLSGLAGAFSQQSLQTVVGSMERNAYFYSAEISFCTAVCLLFSMMVNNVKNVKHSKVGSTDDKSSNGKNHGGYFDHWSLKTFIPIVVKASGGILTALVHKHSGSVMKGFSLVMGLVFSALLQTVLDGNDLKTSQLLGTALVLLSSWMHFTSPP